MRAALARVGKARSRSRRCAIMAQHRIKAERRVEIQAHGSGADQIIGLADDEGADLLVTGAYGHNRVNEWIFGGMTRDLLISSPICCLISH
jgi:nucleotide-binding universal stress UspA family protein